MKKVILKIEGMTCSACSSSLEKYLLKQKGIDDALVNLVMSSASISYEDDMSETDSEYSLLNSLLVAKEVQDSKTVLELMKRYVAGKSIVSSQFKMLD